MATTPAEQAKAKADFDTAIDVAAKAYTDAINPPVVQPPAPPPAPNQPPAAGTVLATEHGTFTVPADTLVQYGADTRWSRRTILAGIATVCDSTTFGGDPASGAAKSCVSLGAPGTLPPAPPAPPPSPPPPPAPPPAPAPATGGRVAPYGDPKAYYTPDLVRVPVAQKGNLQALLDQHGKIRLDAADYGAAITLKSGQKILGIPRFTKLGKITVANGCTGATVKGVDCGGIDLLGGNAVTSGNAFGMIGGDIKSNNAKLENNLFASIGGVIDFNAGASGWHRNNRFIRQRTHGSGFNGDFPHFRLTGAPGRTSYGNVNVGTNSLDTRYAGFVVTGQRDFSLVGADFEDYPPWNHRGTGAISCRDVGHFNLIAIGGQLNGVAECIDTGADHTNIICSTLGTTSSKTTLRLSPTAKAIALWDVNTGSGIANGAGNVLQISGAGAITGGNVATAMELVADDLGTSTPWGFPDLTHAVDNPAGDNWKTDRANKPDDSAVVQALLDRNAVNELEPRVYYLNTPLHIKPWSTTVGVAGKTAFVPKRDGMECFDMSTMGSGSKGFNLIDVVVYGGGIGQHTSDLQLTEFNLVNVTVRESPVLGFGIEGSFCWDNGWLEHCTFYKCGSGLRSRAAQPAFVWAYIDKTNLMRNRFILCDLGLDLQADRPDNQNVFVENLFDRCVNGAANLKGAHNFPLYVNSLFSLCGGDTMCASDQMAFYVGCGWKAAAGTRYFVGPNSVVEGGVFDANGTGAQVFAPGGGSKAQIHNTQTSVPIGAVRVSVNSSGAKPITVGGQTVLDGTIKPGTRFLRDR